MPWAEIGRSDPPTTAPGQSLQGGEGEGSPPSVVVDFEIQRHRGTGPILHALRPEASADY